MFWYYFALSLLWLASVGLFVSGLRLLRGGVDDDDFPLAMIGIALFIASAACFSGVLSMLD